MNDKLFLIFFRKVNSAVKTAFFRGQGHEPEAIFFFGNSAVYRFTKLSECARVLASLFHVGPRCESGGAPPHSKAPRAKCLCTQRIFTEASEENEGRDSLILKNLRFPRSLLFY